MATGTTYDLGSPEPELNSSCVLYCYVCSCAFSILLKPLWLTGLVDMPSFHNRGFILSIVKRLLDVKVCLASLLGFDDHRCKLLPAPDVSAVM